MRVRWYCIAVEESSFLLNVLGWHWLIRSYRFQVYIIYILHWDPLSKAKSYLKQLDDATPLPNQLMSLMAPNLLATAYEIWHDVSPPTYLAGTTLSSPFPLLSSYTATDSSERTHSPSRTFAWSTLSPALAVADIFPSSQGLHSQGGLS